MRSTHTPTSIFASPKFTHPYHPQNCTKSPHNSINHFDNHFDTPSKYPLTNTNNKLSDNYKIHQNLPKSEKTHHSPTRSPPKYYHHQFQNHPSTKPLNKHRHNTNQLRNHTLPSNTFRHHPKFAQK